MSAATMDVFLLAAPQPGIEHSVLVLNLAAAFKKEAGSIEKMLSQPRNLVKMGVTPEIAAKYKLLIEKAGGQCELVARGQASSGSAEVSELVPPVPTPPAAAAPAAEPVVTAAQAEPAAIAVPPPVAEIPAVKPEIQKQAATAASPASIAAAADVLPQEPAKEAAEAVKEAEEIAQELSSPVACYCVKCGTAIRVGQHKCEKCFTPVTEYVHKNKVTASLLALFVGGFGLHRLYLGHWWGIIYLIFFCTLIPSLVAIIEAIVFFLTPSKKWEAHYGRIQKTSGVMGALFVLALVISIAVTWTLVSLSLPLYQDYLKRAQVVDAMPLVLDARKKVADYIHKEGSYPSQNAEVGIETQVSDSVIQIISVQNDAILLVVYQLPGVKERYTILWAPSQENGRLSWDCSEGSMPQKYRPAECRGGAVRKKPNISAADKAAAESRLVKQLYSENRHISLQVPLSWSAKELLPGAVIGAANLGDETYLVVLEDAKIDFEENLTLADYSRNIQLQLAENIKDGMVQGDAYPVTIAGLPGEQFIFPGVVNGIRISYMITLLEGDTHFYRVLGWTLESRMEKNKELLKRISESVKIH